MASRNVWIASGCVKPGCTWRMATKVRTINPDTINSVSANAICETTRALRVRCRPGASLPVRPPSLSELIFGVPNFSTATRPNSAPLTAETARVKPNTVASTAISSTRGISAGAIHCSNRTVACANARPSTPPARASNTLSDNRTLAMRPRVAPSAERIASSC